MAGRIFLQEGMLEIPLGGKKMVEGRGVEPPTPTLRT